MVSLPAISVPALSTFTEALSYWEDRTRFVMAGNLTTAVATNRHWTIPIADPLHRAQIGRLPDGSPETRRRAGQGAAESRPDPGLPGRQRRRSQFAHPERAENSVPGITYASMRVSVQPVDASMMSKSSSTNKPSSSDESSSSSSSSSKKSSSGSSKGGVEGNHEGVHEGHYQGHYEVRHEALQNRYAGCIPPPVWAWRCPQTYSRTRMAIPNGTPSEWLFPHRGPLRQIFGAGVEEKRHLAGS